MTYLVDANVLSEPTRPRPLARVVQWLRATARDRRGPDHTGRDTFRNSSDGGRRRRRQLERWFTQGIEKIHCLPWQATTGLRWAKLLAELRAAGQSMPIKDSWIASTALENGLTLVTRNQRDFMKAGVKILDPFGEA